MTSSIDFKCVDCGSDTMKTLEYYVVNEPTWRAAVPNGEDIMLCVGCLELRLGRVLQQEDFLWCAVNLRCLFISSERLRERMNADGMLTLGLFGIPTSVITSKINK
jgi:hypothetical protein